ncbi:MAG: class I SAM-dependent methyltransferase [Clostridium sp.]|nr:class I SAM-dependent methyltransferase [Clostridium sp.]
MNNTNLFSGRAEVYTIARPAYPKALIDELYTNYGVSSNSVIADIGSGTGKLTKQLLDKGSTVYAVEPNEDMRSVAERELSKYSNFISVSGNSENTLLPDYCVDLITVAQAFHWFDIKKFRLECDRIKKDNSKIILIWNSRDLTSDFNRESYEIYSKYCPRFKGFHGGTKVDDIRFAEFFNGRYEHIIFDNPLMFTKDMFISRSLSGSYSLQEGDEYFDDYIASLEKLFDKYAVNELVKMNNKTDAYIGY